MYMKSLMQLSTSSSNYSSCFAGGFDTSNSDLDMNYKLSVLKRQAFNTFALSRRYFMSPAHNFYMQLQQQQLQQKCTRPNTLTGFGPAGYEQRMLRDILMDDVSGKAISNINNLTNLSQMKKLNFYSAPYILAPGTIASSTVAFAASNLFFKNTDPAASVAPGAKPANQQQQGGQNNGIGECNSIMSNFIQLNMSNSSHMNSSSYQNLTKSNPGNQNSHGNMNSNAFVQQPYQQQSNVLYVAYCLSDDQR